MLNIYPAKVMAGKLVSLSLMILLLIANPSLFVYFIFSVMIFFLIFWNLDKKEAVKLNSNIQDVEVIKLYPDGILRRMQNLKQNKK